MEHHAFLRRSVEMEIVIDGDIDQPLGRQPDIRWVLQIVRGMVTAGLAIRRAIHAEFAIIGAVGQEL